MDGVVHRNCAGETRRRELASEGRLWRNCGNWLIRVDAVGKAVLTCRAASFSERSKQALETPARIASDLAFPNAHDPESP